MKLTKKTGYMNVYPFVHTMRKGDVIHETEESAKKFATDDVLFTTCVNWYELEEGDNTVKEFSLEAVNGGAPVKTIDGREAHILTTTANLGTGRCIVALVREKSGLELIHTYLPDGKVLNAASHKADLVLA